MSGALVLAVGWGCHSTSSFSHVVLPSRPFHMASTGQLALPYIMVAVELPGLLRPRPGMVSLLLCSVGQRKSQGQPRLKDKGRGCTFQNQEWPVFTEMGGLVGSLLFRQTRSSKH